MATKLLIVGGVAGGASAAARARRIDEDAQIILFEKGEYISFANCGLPYYIGKQIKERQDLLVTTPRMLKDRFKIEVRTSSEVTAINTDKKEVTVKDHKTGNTYTETYDKLILSPGAYPFKPPIPGIDLDTVFTLRTIPDTDQIREFVDNKKPERAVIVGGGFIGLEAAENLVKRGVRVTIVEMLDQVLVPLDVELASILHQHLVQNGVELKLGEAVKSMEKNGEKTVVTTSAGSKIEADMVIMSVGVRPRTRLAKEAGIELGERGGIKVDEHMRTSDPDVYAVGDVVEVKDLVTGKPTMVPLAGPANKQGRIAADNALGRNRVFKSVQGTAIVKVFDMVAANTGSNEKTLKREKIPYRVSYTHTASHATYYPGAQQMQIKLIFSPEDGKILGAQIVGQKGVDKRIDVIATAIRAGMTVFDLEELELAYAPPFSSAYDPVNIAGFAAANMLRGDLKTVNWDEIDCLDPKEHTLLDLRDRIELKLEPKLDKAVHIPLNQLRDNLPRLDKDKTYIAYCATGKRSYVAHRILQQHGYKSRNLSGGLKTLSAPKKQLDTMKICLQKIENRIRDPLRMLNKN